MATHVLLLTEKSAELSVIQTRQIESICLP